MADQAAARQVKEASKKTIFAKPNVVGVGVGYKVSGGRQTDELAVMVLVRQKIPVAGLADKDMVPREVEGVRTDVIQVGHLRAQQHARTDRWRPAPGGVSIGHYKITAGTLGAVVRDRATGDRLILSNNHVMANSNDADPGDPILQPGTYDGGQSDADVIAWLERFAPIRYNRQPTTSGIANGYAGFGNSVARLFRSGHWFSVMQLDPEATNRVDCAVARPVNDAGVLDEIIKIGVVSGTLPAELGMAVRKSGRTTELTTGTITVLDASVDVSYGEDRVARFEDQIVAGPMSQGGDSGSLVVAGGSLKAVGLLFAGSEQSTIVNPIQAVLDALDVTI